MLPPELSSYLNMFKNIPFLGELTSKCGAELIPTLVVLGLFSTLITLSPGLEMGVVFQSTIKHRRPSVSSMICIGHNSTEALILLVPILFYEIGAKNFTKAIVNASETSNIWFECFVLVLGVLMFWFIGNLCLEIFEELISRKTLLEKLEEDAIRKEKGIEKKTAKSRLSEYQPTHLAAFKRGCFLASINPWSYIYATIAFLSLITFFGSYSFFAVILIWFVSALFHSIPDFLITGLGIPIALSHASKHTIQLTEGSQSESTAFWAWKVVYFVVFLLVLSVLWNSASSVISSSMIIGKASQHYSHAIRTFIQGIIHKIG